MNSILRPILAVGLCASLAACDAPRSAGFQNEILSATSSGADPSASALEIVAVTRANQTAIAGWPDIEGTSHRWLVHTDQPSSMLIAAGDKLAVTVWDTEDNSLLAGPGGRVAQLGEVPVNSQGSIFLPFIGDVKVAGNSPETAREKIEDRYIATIPSAQVQVYVIPGRANTVNLVSGMGAPGVYPMDSRNITLLAILAQGGGVSNTLQNPQVTLMRGNEVFQTSLHRLYDDPSIDPTLVGGDRIIIENDDRSFLSLGAAGTQAEHVFPDDDVTLLQALSLVGGVDGGRANPKGVLILREYPRAAIGQGPNKEQVVFTVDLTSADGLFAARNFKIMPGDLLYATESPLGAARNVMGLIGTAFGIANNL